MPEAVIVDTLRTPIGRAFKGSLAQLRPRRRRLRRRPVARAQPRRRSRPVEDIICGIGMPQGLRPSTSAASIPALREAAEEVNGVTVSRYCSSCLDAIRHAGNAIKDGEGDAYIAAGVEWVCRFNERTEPPAPTTGTEADGKNSQPNVYIDMGITAVNVAEEVRGQPRPDGQVRAALPGTGGQVAGDRVLRSRDRSVDLGRERCPRTTALASNPNMREAHRAGGGLKRQRRHRRRLLPLNDGAAAVLIMSDTKAKELGLKRRARIVTAATHGNDPE